MKKDMNAVVWEEGKWFVAQCLEIDIASQGLTEQDALDNLRDAIQLHLSAPAATILPDLRKIEVEVAV